jgi:hypothetical protein
MGQSQVIDRDNLLAKLAERSGLEAEALEEARARLAAHTPSVLLRHWFGPADPECPRTESDRKLRALIRRRSILFEWVYGGGSPVSRDLLYVRLPSGEKRRLVSLLLAVARQRLPWMDSRTLHAMAFRPSAFGAASSLAPDHRKDSWGPLYRRVGIPKGNGKRVLTIPNPVLKQVHRSLLSLIGQTLERSLDKNVFGATKGVSGPTFRNAAAHREGEYVASFDLKDFFPSVRVGDIVRGLQRVRKHGIPMVDPASLPDLLAESPQRRELKWTDDAMLLVARLCTHRSRLPQGAPLSPLLASVAFSRYDRNIIGRLRKRFGAGEFQYTRYFDDITVSLSRDAARKCKITEAPQALQHIEECLTGALGGSSFSLNPSKSRCARLRVPRAGVESTSDALAEVTGLIVRPGAVALPRATKRWIRETAHRLGQSTLVEAARAWAPLVRREETEWKSVAQGHRWKQTPNFHRRCSAERLAVLMLQRTNPDLRLRLLHKDWYAWQARLEDGSDVRSGRAARGLLETLLAAHWRGQTVIRKGTKGEVIFSHDRVDVCAVSSESDLGYLWLPMDEAIPVADYWHHLHGMLAYLAGCPDGPEFKAVHEWRLRLAQAITRPRLGGTTDQPKEQGPPDHDFVWFVDEALERAVHECFSRLCDFAQAVGAAPTSAWGRLQGALFVRVDTDQSFHDWLGALSQLTVRSLPRLPRPVRCAPDSPTGGLFDYLRIREDFALARVHSDYGVVQQIEAAIGLRDQRVQVPARFLKAQMSLLKHIGAAFASASAETGGAAVSPTNPWVHPVADQLVGSFERLGEIFADVRSTPTERRLLHRGSGTEYLRQRSIVVDQLQSRTNEECWKHLFEFAKILIEATREVIEPELCRDEIPKRSDGPHPDQTRRNKVWKQLEGIAEPEYEHGLRLLVSLRNRAAHPATPERRGEWVSLQSRVAGRLGRKWKSESGKACANFHAPDDLQLKPYEAVCLKLRLMQALAEILAAAKTANFWGAK